VGDVGISAYKMSVLEDSTTHRISLSFTSKTSCALADKDLASGRVFPSKKSNSGSETGRVACINATHLW
jgi:hypothetical protein